MNLVELFDKLLRQNPYIPRVSWLRDVLRKPYHWLLDVGVDSLPMTVGRALEIQVPPKFVTTAMREYEIPSCQEMENWLTVNRGGWFIDVGAAFGYMTCGAMFEDPTATVVAVDPSPKNLAVLHSLCSLAPNQGRLHFFRALIGSDVPNCSNSFEILERESIASIQGVSTDTQWTLEGNVETLDQIPKGTPQISLDTLLLDHLIRAGAPCLVKCDVEGAEKIVLDGMRRILSQVRPTIMLSVHPPFLPKFDTSTQQIEALLHNAGYDYEIIAEDHEQHWYCKPR